MAEDHYFSANPASPDERFPLHVRLAGRDLQLDGAPGVFSHDALDDGTAVLLNNVPKPPAGNLLDIGCGWGAIALTMGLLRPDAKVWAIDVNERALDLTRRNAELARALYPIAALVAIHPDAVPSAVMFDAIWSNPPIRVGKEALHDTLTQWLPRLRSGAMAHLVVHKNLGADSLTTWLNTQRDSAGRPWGVIERIASARGFRVLQFTRSGEP